MTASEHPTLLAEQLSAVLSEIRHGRGDLREAACLAGQVQRLTPDASILEDAQQLVERAAGELLGDAFSLASLASEVVDADDPDDAADALLALDEACAGACFVGLTRSARSAVERVVEAISAAPERWGVHVALARTVLQQCPPPAADPAAALWKRIEACPTPIDDQWGAVPLDGKSVADAWAEASQKAESSRPTESGPASASRKARLPELGAPTRSVGGLSVRRAHKEVS